MIFKTLSKRQELTWPKWSNCRSEINPVRRKGPGKPQIARSHGQKSPAGMPLPVDKCKLIAILSLSLSLSLSLWPLSESPKKHSSRPLKAASRCARLHNKSMLYKIIHSWTARYGNTYTSRCVTAEHGRCSSKIQQYMANTSCVYVCDPLRRRYMASLRLKASANNRNLLSVVEAANGAQSPNVFRGLSTNKP